MASYILHSVSCVCFDFKIKENKQQSGQYDQSFSVCSEIDQNGKIIPHIAQCPSCGNVHLIEDFGKSKLQGKDETSALPNIEELELEVPDRVARLLKINKCPIYIWQAALYTFKHNVFPSCILLGREEYTETGNPVPQIITKLLIVHDKDKFEILNDRSDPLMIAKPE